MAGREYLEKIRTELRSGRHQHRMGENLLRAFGYVRRRATAVEEINTTLDELGLVTTPPITTEMPLRAPRIRFRLRPDGVNEGTDPSYEDQPEALDSEEIDSQLQDLEDSDDDLSYIPEPAFTISELASANTEVERVSSNASIQVAYTTMLLHKYSQLVIADSDKPMQQDIKGVVSFQSMTNALMNGNPKIVGDCIDKDFCTVESNTDLNSVVEQLKKKDVVLVIGQDKRLQGIVTAWDLAEEFAYLVDPFKRIGEIESRLRTLIERRIEKDKVAEFLSEHVAPSNDSTGKMEELTMGELQRVLEFPEHWDSLKLPFDRGIFIGALDEARGYRNRLMHFREPLDEDEMKRLTDFCNMVRQIQL